MSVKRTPFVFTPPLFSLSPPPPPPIFFLLYFVSFFLLNSAFSSCCPGVTHCGCERTLKSNYLLFLSVVQLFFLFFFFFFVALKNKIVSSPCGLLFICSFLSVSSSSSSSFFVYFIRLSVCLSVSLCLSLPACLSVRPSVSLSVSVSLLPFSRSTILFFIRSFPVRISSFPLSVYPRTHTPRFCCPLQPLKHNHNYPPLKATVQPFRSIKRLKAICDSLHLFDDCNRIILFPLPRL